MVSKIQASDLLTHYEQLYPKEGKVCAAFRKALNTCSHNFLNRDNFDPGHITASCFVLTPKLADAALILIYHKTLKRWLQPGGHLENSDETMEQAAKRELKEEAGIGSEIMCAGLIDLDIHTIPAKGGQKTHQHFDMRFLFITEKTPLIAGSDVSKAQWVTVANLTPENADESILRALKKASKLLK